MAIAVGDIHGCIGPLRQLAAQIPAGEELVFLGDYIDRGPGSAQVIRFLRQLAHTRPCRFLLGNHEDMLLNAIRDPQGAAVWLMNGGRATLASYGVDPAAWRRGTHRGDFLGADLAFFQHLERFWEDDQTLFVHAGVDPAVADMRRQNPQDLIWIRERFFRRGHLWQGKEIIFGHTPTQFMGLRLGTVFKAPPLFGIDTGCVYGGRLTAMDSRTHQVFQVPGWQPRPDSTQ
ncbi:MAG: serine/threonine protein phosphatase [Deltaproteobacteria bacterium]|nr:serine/threonine protein phosphatase [Deltaproteobacteria bacterium]